MVGAPEPELDRTQTVILVNRRLLEINYQSIALITQARCQYIV